MATFSYRNDTITRTRQAATKLLRAAEELETCKGTWGRGIGAQIVDATGTDPNAVGYKANDFTGHEGLVKSDITQVLGAALDALRVRGNGSAAAIGFLGATPAARIAHVADPSGGATVDAEARSAINSILATLETFGLHASS